MYKVCIYFFTYLFRCHASWTNEQRYRPEIWYTHSPRSYLKITFLFFRKSVWGPCHGDFPHILFAYLSVNIDFLGHLWGKIFLIASKWILSWRVLSRYWKIFAKISPKFHNVSIFNEIAHDFDGKNNFVREIPWNSGQQTVGDFRKLQDGKGP